MIDLKFTDGLIPVITQDYYTKEVLILSYMNTEAYEKTVDEKVLYYYSRSKKALWKKGETSGHTQELISLQYDCDGDALLAIVKQKGPACHTGEVSCFHNDIIQGDTQSIINKLYKRIMERKDTPLEGSYTNYLFDKGVEKILKKVGEECSEVIIAAMKDDKDETIYEIADLMYHGMVLMVNQGITLQDVLNTLEERYKK